MTPPEFLTYLQWPGDSPIFPGGSGPAAGEGPSGATDRDDFVVDTDGVDIEEEIDSQHHSTLHNSINTVSLFFFF